MWPLPRTQLLLNMNDDISVYDDGDFSIITTRWGTFSSKDKEGQELCCGIDKEAVIFWSREHIHGFPNSYVTQTKAITSDSLK